MKPEEDFNEVLRELYRQWFDWPRPIVGYSPIKGSLTGFWDAGPVKHQTDEPIVSAPVAAYLEQWFQK